MAAKRYNRQEILSIAITMGRMSVESLSLNLWGDGTIELKGSGMSVSPEPGIGGCHIV